jgi:hypothetical protein
MISVSDNGSLTKFSAAFHLELMFVLLLLMLLLLLLLQSFIFSSYIRLQTIKAEISGYTTFQMVLNSYRF